jgi:beta-1,4-mannosyl-glycoprotein beta-1,4-N-acetylglucosaminyltransferase
MPQTNDPWIRENFQRNCIARGLKSCHNNDIIIVADADEIPKASVVASYKKEMGLTCVETNLYYYKLNYLVTNTKWYKLRIMPYSEIANGDIQRIRGKDDYNYNNTIYDGGWHFSYFGDQAHIKQKLESYAHVEYNTQSIKSEENLLAAINHGKDLLGRNVNVQICDTYDSLPRFVVDNIDYYRNKKLIACDSSTYWQNKRN